LHPDESVQTASAEDVEKHAFCPVIQRMTDYYGRRPGLFRLPSQEGVSQPAGGVFNRFSGAAGARSDVAVAHHQREIQDARHMIDERAIAGDFKTVAKHVIEVGDSYVDS
jgi:hypothetical protein